MRLYNQLREFSFEVVVPAYIASRLQALLNILDLLGRDSPFGDKNKLCSVSVFLAFIFVAMPRPDYNLAAVAPADSNHVVEEKRHMVGKINIPFLDVHAVSL